ncbi:hypothetical protein GCM10010174_30130 [Kutzneria viridogrisea]|uniref:Uncharacterized protein n=2 Tax=Kutzneria TaxID=43356 RepID=W5VYL7_9PSEU|nr:hypothetical protein [Kutzneria albida]AHH93642.1 hypothetical protein KALB_265 [Kutzneria albida DSM 43870]MBA8928974.1 hypothetical protein [Kutzneria viridogrisea]
MATHVRGGRSTAATVVRMIGTVLALILVARILFLLLGANPDNQIAATVGRWADTVALWFINLFDTGNHAFSVLLNYGLAAVFWLVVTGLIARLLYRAG